MQVHEYWGSGGVPGAILEAAPHTLKLPLPTCVPPNPSSEKAPWVTTSESFFTLFPFHPQLEPNSHMPRSFQSLNKRFNITEALNVLISICHLKIPPTHPIALSYFHFFKQRRDRFSFHLSPRNCSSPILS